MYAYVSYVLYINLYIPSTTPVATFFFNVLFIFERETERQSASWGGAEREGDAESEAGSRL